MRLERLDNAKVTTPTSGEALRFDGHGWTNSSSGFVGTVTISGTNTSSAVTLPVVQATASYQVLITPQTSTGTPAAGSNRPLSISSQTTTGFTLNIEVAPGVGNSVTFAWGIMR